MIAGALLLGPMQSESAAGGCGSPGQSPATGAVTALVGDTTGVAVGVEETAIRWTRWHTRVVYGESATLAGQVVTEDGALPEATVELYAREAGSQKWEWVDSAATDPETGVFTFSCLQPTATTDYRARYEGTLLYAPSHGDREIAVARRVPDSMKRVAPGRFLFNGSVQPTYADQPVQLQRKDCSDCRWRTVASTDSTSQSRWRFTIDASRFTGSRWYRAVVPADNSYVRSYSEHVWRITRK